MILHVTFSDGSNPYVFYGDRHQIAKEWRRWTKYHPDTARPEAYSGNHEVFLGLSGIYILRDSDHWAKATYKHLGYALAALERLGGETL